MATQVILLERVESLGQMGDVVKVRPGYARNYLLPQKKALRASKENIAYFEAKKKHLEADNEKRRKEAEKLAKKLEGIKVPLIRQASEAGQLFGSVTARDIAQEIAKASGEEIDRRMVQMNQNYKLIGLFQVDVMLHPEVKLVATINIARSPEEAKIQAETGKGLIIVEGQAAKDAAAAAAREEAALAAVLEADALKAEKERQAGEQAEASEEAQASAEKSKARAEKKKTRKPKDVEAAAESAESPESDEE